MRIVIDLQAAQSPGSRHRGIGRYSVALARAMIRHRGTHEILIALNGMFADTIGPVRDMFSDLLPASAIRVWQSADPPTAGMAVTPDELRAAELVREAFLSSLEPDVVHVSSLFETATFAVTSVATGAFQVPVAVTLYDLIPYIYPAVYQPTRQMADEYQQKIEHLRRAQLWLAISESSRREGMELLGLPEDRVVNISSAAHDHFTPAEVPREREDALRRQYGLGRPFVMYTGGIDHRKNVDGLIRAWSGVPADLRESHQLAVVCAINDESRAKLETLIGECGLAPGEVIFSGFVPEHDLLDLYRLCRLFVFPSKHEGFGLPALEAMACGVPVIGADNSSIPEVIGLSEALFDAASTTSMASKITECLRDEALRKRLARHGLERAQRFSWDASAMTALAAMERLHAGRAAPPAAPARRPRLALVTPMPPQRSGIADASAEILPELSKHYEVELVVESPASVADAGHPCHAAEWFLDHAGSFDRIAYQFGNSEFHAFMFPLLERHPGTVILHDFFLSGLVAHEEGRGGGGFWTRALHESHGWHALAERFQEADTADVVFRYPANFEVIRAASGVVVHSRYALRLARDWYGPAIAAEWSLVPLMRSPAPHLSREEARRRLGLASDEFVVCSFGHLGPIKLNHRLLRAWRSSELASSPRCRLVFVGERSHGDYGDAFAAELASGPGKVDVTGWVGAAAYSDWLAAADLAVQLRSMSRGETSAAVLDCMNHGLPVIANSQGAMADLDPAAVSLLPEAFGDEELASELVSLWQDPARRSAMGAHGRECIRVEHSAQASAQGYARAIEAHAARAARGRAPLVRELGMVLAASTRAGFLDALSRAIAQDFPRARPARQLLVAVGPAQESPFPEVLDDLLRQPPQGWRVEVVRHAAGEWQLARQLTLAALDCPPHLLPDEPVVVQPGDAWAFVHAGPHRPPPHRLAALGLPPLVLPADGDPALMGRALSAAFPDRALRHWYVDVSELVQRDARTGIQRVVKNHLLELLWEPPEATCIVPVCATDAQPGYRVAEDFTLRLGGIEGGRSQGSLIDARAGDVFLGLDLQPHIVPAQSASLAAMQEGGVRIAFMVYDLLPVQLPDCFPPGASAIHQRWLSEVARSDLAICISRSVADEFSRWMDAQGIAPQNRPGLESVHLGGDLAHSLPSTGMPTDSGDLLARLRAWPAFLMVGTIEPRKGHAQALAAFELLWSRGVDASLVICGRHGWMVDELVASISGHPERGRRLFWIEDASDELLEEIYAACSCVLVASRGEGFGLPLVEGARHGRPLLSRDLPVFREVAGTHAFYFSGDRPEDLASAVTSWLALWKEKRHPDPAGMTWLTWEESARRLKRALLRHFDQSV